MAAVLKADVAPAEISVTQGLRERLGLAYGYPEWALLFEVRNGGGYDADRSCDAMALGLWPSNGHKVIGFEIKASRADWLRELKDPWKAETFGRYCDEWWLVIASPDMVRLDELPPGWGVMVPRGRVLRRSHQATLRKKVDPMPRGLQAALMKRSFTTATDEAKAGYERGVEHGKREVAQDHREKVERIVTLERQISDYEQASGLKIKDRWQGSRKVGEAVRFVLDGGLTHLQRDLVRIDTTAAGIRERIAGLGPITDPTQEASP